MVNALGFTKQPWGFDNDLEDFSKVYLKQGIPFGKDGKKVGRNDSCPCGKLKSDGQPIKYKKCCGK